MINNIFRAYDGITLHVWYYLTSVKRYCIQLSRIRLFLLPHFAVIFYEAGFEIFLYDNRSWGDSDRQNNVYDLFNCVVALPRVDPERTVNTTYAAAVDKPVSGESCSFAWIDRIPAIVNNYVVLTMQCIASSPEKAKLGRAPILFPYLHAYESFNRIYECGGRWENRGQVMIQPVSPSALLMVILGNDTRELKRMILLDAASYFDIYRGEYFEENIAAQIELPQENLLD
ncbi:hypothetical protein BGW36DRAFT_420679 [Talaromyces proteolyticus]|uniref:Uncharacterized protein n=1 Tax=Talaromyces proteolyticus TaxID=1131652 RepID=A0AAD4KEX6_9EURO|nr:uncharacterized protein BGW36DRAFT_420679 [Talaromyces proteolyticus]KAH8690333.1 hypothetical protein BGW36DRAFT_420679 [Talaromyces proteolyticus]